MLETLGCCWQISSIQWQHCKSPRADLIQSPKSFPSLWMVLPDLASHSGSSLGRDGGVVGSWGGGGAPLILFSPFPPHFIHQQIYWLWFQNIPSTGHFSPSPELPCKCKLPLCPWLLTPSPQVSSDSPLSTQQPQWDFDSGTQTPSPPPLPVTSPCLASHRSRAACGSLAASLDPTLTTPALTYQPWWPRFWLKQGTLILYSGPLHMLMPLLQSWQTLTAPTDRVLRLPPQGGPPNHLIPAPWLMHLQQSCLQLCCKQPLAGNSSLQGAPFIVSLTLDKSPSYSAHLRP